MRSISRDFFQAFHWLTAVVGFSVICLIGCSEEKPDPPIMLDLNKQVGPPETELEKQVRTHGWWTDRVDLERVRLLVGQAQECPPGKTFVFDSRAFQNVRIVTSEIREDVGMAAQTGVPSPAWISVRDSGRWSKEKMLGELVNALDAALERRNGKK